MPGPSQPIVVSRDDIRRVADAIGTSVTDGPSCNMLREVLTGSFCAPGQFVHTLVTDTLGSHGSLADALDVLDDSGLLEQRVIGVMTVRDFDGVIYWADAHASQWGTWRGAWNALGSRYGISVDVIDELPVFDLDNVAPVDTVMFRSGETADLSSVAAGRFVVAPHDQQRVRGMWQLPQLPQLPVEIMWGPLTRWYHPQ
jgi:hypothetical protein